MTARAELLTVAGEASGDRIAAAVARAAGAIGATCWGIGGEASRRAGIETVVDAPALGVMGLGDVVAEIPAIAGAVMRLVARVRRSPPAAAVLIGFTELNLRLGRALRRAGVPVLWCVAPQAWAWRPGRFRALSTAVDRMAVILPFEEPLWRAHGVDAHYVGHPSVRELPAPEEARQRLGLAPAPARCLAVLPGSRGGEVRRLAPLLCEAAADLRDRGVVAEVRVLAAASLRPEPSMILRASAARAGVAVVDVDADAGAAPLLGAFDAALVASGTACLEAALAGASPVIVYRVDWLTHRAARWLVRTPHVGLPNILLGRRAFPELLQDEATADRVASAARALLEDEPARRAALDAQRELRALLAPPSTADFGERVARLLEPWVPAS